MKVTPQEQLRRIIRSKDPTIKIYTFQHIDVLKVLEKEGVFYPKERNIFKNPDDRKWFGSSYNWMKNQMNQRLDNYSGETPIWGWIEQPGNISVRKSFGANQVRLTANVDRNRVLLSDFDLWHAVLNNYYLSLTSAEEERIDSGKVVVSQEDKEKRWEYIFDLTKPPQRIMDYVFGQPYSGRMVQACIDGLKLSEIENIKVYD